MEAQKFELLESRVLKAIDLITRLREENSNLAIKIDRLKKLTEEKDRQIAALQGESTQKMQEFTAKSRQLQQERDQIRLKVESLLDKLEKIDII